MARRCACAILHRGGEILLGRRAARSRHYPGRWDLFGGHVEEGEDLGDALTRELREELSIIPLSSRLLGTIAEPTPLLHGDALYAIFDVREWQGAPTMMGEEHSELQWFGIVDACALPDLALDAYVPLFETLADA